MGYEDASQAPQGHSEPIARPDVDHLPAGSYGPATGDVITGDGTSTGAAGADSVAAAPGTITEVQGAGGQTVVANGAFQAAGQYGLLSMDAQGNFNYVRNPNTPDGVKDVFHYTLADATGANASTTLTIDIGQVAAAAAGQGVVALPAGVDLSDIHVNGRDLVIDMPDGTQMVIPNGAVFVPEISIGDVQVPPTNIAALLIDSEPQPAAGPPQSSGGDWNDPVPPLDPGVPLGDLIPPTELNHTPPDFTEPGQFVNTIPTILIETPDFPAGVVDASESVNEAGLPARNGDLPNEPAGSGEIADGNGTNNSDPSETNTGTIVFTAKDGLDSVTVNGVAVSQVGQQIAGQHGTMTITGIDLANGQITYSYTLADNTSGDNTNDVFTVVVTDHDGDTATGSLTVNIVDDVPTARNDTDSTDLVSHVATGNVMTGADTTSGAAGADTVGADNATLTAVSGAGGSDSSFDASGNLVVQGDNGTLTIKADGSYTYTESQGAPGGSSDTFTYTLTDGDGDTSQATLTITNPDHTPTVVIETPDFPAGVVNASESVDEKGLPARDGNLPNEPAGSGEIADGNGTNNSDPSETNTGTIVFNAQDGVGSITVGGTAVTAVGQHIQGQYGVLTITSIDLASGKIGYSYTLSDNTSGDNTHDDFSVVVTDSDGDHATATLTVNIVDDVPTARNDTDSLDSNHTATGNVMTGAGTTSGTAGADTVGADNASLTSVSSNSTNASDASFDSNGNLVVHGEFGTLTIQADGTYSYTLDQGAHGGANDVFTYTLTDGDGDTSSATLTINVPLQNLPPTASDSSVNVSEEGLAGGNADSSGSPDTTNSATASGTITASDPNGDSLTMTMGTPSGSFTSGGQAVHWAVSADGHTLTGYTGSDSTANHVIVVTLSNSGGYNVQLIQPFDDPNPNIEDSISFSVPVTVSDGNGGTATAHIGVTVEDDSPTVAATVNSDATVTVDESGPASAASVGLGGHTAGDDPDVSGAGPIGTATTGTAGIVNAGVSYGADGPGSTSYSLAVTNSASGLTTTDGHAITLEMSSDGTIVGIVQGGDFDGDVAFAIGINGSNGQVTIDQYLSLHNPDATDPNDPVHLADGSIGVTVTATDADGDHASTANPVDISGQFTFLDDGPQLTDVHATQATVTVDESGPVPASATVSLGTYTGGDDPDVSGAGPIATGSSGSSVVTATIDYGADGQGTPATYSLAVENATSGLTTTDGHAIDLVMTADGTIVGVVQGGAFDGEVAFAVGVNSSTGEVTIDQYLSLHNPDATNPNDPVHLNDGTVGVVVSATDGDGDPVSNAGNPVDISGQFTFLDDGPHITSAVASSATVTVDESGPVPASATVALGTGNVGGDDPDVGGTGPIATGNSDGASMITATIDYGADGQGTPASYSLAVENATSGLTTTDGHAITLEMTDAGTIVGIVSGGAFDGDVAFAVGVNSSTGEVTIDQYLSLHNPDATNPNDPVHLNDGTIGVTVSATDGDGDPVANATPVDISGQITFLDDGPSVSPGLNQDATVTVDESGPVPTAATVSLGGYTGGNDPDVSGSGPIAEGDTGKLSAVDVNALFGADGPALNGISYALTVDNAVSGLETTDGHAINLVLTSAGTIVGVVSGGGFDGDVAFAIGINSSTGQVTVDQYLSLHNPDATNPNDPVHLDGGSIGVVVTATDGDGDPVSNSANPVDISGQVTFLDDGPQITDIHAAQTTITVDESGPVPASATVALGTGNTGGDDPDVNGAGPIATGNSGSAVVSATIDFGADGQGTPATYSLVVDNATSGLETTDGHAINLVMTDAGTIVGIVSGGAFDGDVAFAVGVNSSSGEVTIDQYLSLHNPDATNPNDPVHLNDGTIGVVVSATDGDGDPVSNSGNPVDISGQFTFLDDGPHITSAAASSATVTVDESGPVPASATVSLGTYTGGDDPDVSGTGPIATGNSGTSGMISAVIAYGADGQGSNPVYSLAVENATSGLTTTDGHAIALELTTDGTIVGVVQGGDFDGKVAFAVGIDSSSGAVTIDQYLSLHNPDATNPNDAVHLADGTIGVVVSSTDGDGDPVSNAGSPVDISGQITFLDDGPLAADDSFTQPSENQAFSFDVFGNDKFGADGVDIHNASDVTFTQPAHGTVSYDASTGLFTFTPEAGQQGTVTFTYTILDGDNDPSTATVTLTLANDSTPTPTAQVAYSDDDGLANGNPASTTGDIDANVGETPTTNPSEAIYNGQLVVDFHSDVPGTIGFANLNGTTGTVGTETVTYSWNGTTETLTATTTGGTRPGTVLFDIHITDPHTGTYVLTQDANILQAAGGNETSAPDVVLNYQAVDSDGSTSTAGTLTITFNDDAPTLSNLGTGASVTVDESGPVPASATVALGTGNTGGDDPDVNGAGPIASGHSTGSVVTATIDYGADGQGTPATYSLVVDNATSGLTTTDGHAINLVMTDAGTIVGVVQGGAFDGDVAFAVGVNSASGEVTIDQYLSLHNPDATNPNDPVHLNDGTIGVVVSATDGDGDPVSNAGSPVDISGQFTFLDDGPQITSAAASTATVTVDESGPVPASATVALGTGNVGGDDPDVSGTGPIASGNSGSSVITATIDYGADGQGTPATYSLAVENATSGLTTTDGHAINLTMTDAGTIVGIVSGGAFDGDVAFAVGVNSASGEVTIDQYLSLHNPDATDPNDPVHLNDGTIGVVVSATDGDGDSVSNAGNPVDISGQLTFLDDGPQITSAVASTATVTVDESGPVPASATVALGTGNVGGDDPDVGGTGPIATGNSNAASLVAASIDYGADGHGTGPVYSLAVENATSGLTTTDGHAITLETTDAGTIVGIVSGGTFNGDVAFAVGIDSATGAVTVDQYLSLHNPDPTNPNDPVQLAGGTIGVVFSATDGDGDPVSNSATPVDISHQITFLDDGPTLGTFTDADIDNSVGSVNGTYAFNWGADGLGGLTVTGPTIAGVTYTTTQDPDGSTILHAWSGTTELFNLDVHPDGTYQFNLVNPQTATTTTYDLTQLASGQNGWTQTSDGLVEFSPNDHLGNDTGSVNSSGAGFGVNNQFTGNGEAFTMEFHSVGQAGDQPATTNPQYVDSVTLTLPSNGLNGSSETITWYAINTATNTTETGTIAVTGSTTQLVIDPTISFNELVIEGSNATGNGVRLQNAEISQTILPQDADYTFTVGATDGDGDPTSNSSFTIHVHADDTQSAVVHTESLMSTAETSSLIASNDNGDQQQHQRTFTAGNNAAIMGALAAVGLEAEHGHLDLSGLNHGGDHSPAATPLDSATVVTEAVEESHGMTAAHVAQPMATSDTAEAPLSGGHHQQLTEHFQTAHADSGHGPAMTALLHATAAASHAQPGSANAVTAHAVAMPSAQQLAAAMGAHGGQPQTSVGSDNVEHNQVVGKILADALHGGEGHGPNIDALLNSHGAPGHHAGTHDAIEALASHAAGAVSFGHSVHGMAFGTAHAMFSMMHHDAAPPAHG